MGAFCYYWIFLFSHVNNRNKFWSCNTPFLKCLSYIICFQMSSVKNLYQLKHKLFNIDLRFTNYQWNCNFLSSMNRCILMRYFSISFKKTINHIKYIDNVLTYAMWIKKRSKCKHEEFAMLYIILRIIFTM